MPPPPPPPLMDELVEEILLRLPPDSPGTLVRAGLVCSRWHGLVSAPAFRRRFIDFHRHRHGRSPPPMLGFMVYSGGGDDDDATRFISTSVVSGGGLHPHADLRGLQPCDARHGRVLLRGTAGREFFRLVVWNPITGDELIDLPDPPLPPPSRLAYYQWTAAVLCAAAAGDCDHLDCGRGPFTVVLVGTGCYRNFVCIYSSSENGSGGAWNEPTFAHNSGGGSIQSSVRSAMVGTRLYFLLRETGYAAGKKKEKNHHHHYPAYPSILEYDLCTMALSVVKLPEASSCRVREQPFGPIEFTTMEEEDGRLGFVRVEDWGLCLWSREDHELEDQEARWALRKTIRFRNLLPFHIDDSRQRVYCRYLAGSVEGGSTVFLTFRDELFTVDLRSGRFNKVYPHQASGITVAYMNFCTPCSTQADR